MGLEDDSSPMCILKAKRSHLSQSTSEMGLPNTRLRKTANLEGEFRRRAERGAETHPL